SPDVAERFCISARTLKAAQMLASPKLVTMDGKAATFLCGGYQAVPEVTAAGVAGGVGARFEPFGSLLSFRPVICPQEAVKLEIECSVTKLNESHGFSVNGTRVAGRDVEQLHPSVAV